VTPQSFPIFLNLTLLLWIHSVAQGCASVLSSACETKWWLFNVVKTDFKTVKRIFLDVMDFDFVINVAFF